MQDTPVTIVERLGGVATAATLIAACGRPALRSAVSRGDLVRVRRATYATPGTDRARIAAAQVGGVVSHVSAAMLHGLAVAIEPERPQITVPRGRHGTVGQAELHWCDLPSGDVAGAVTTVVRTVADCARTLPFEQALAVADSALRLGRLSCSDLEAVASHGSRIGRARILRVAKAADGRAESPLESMVRARALQAGVRVIPQARVTDGDFFARVDLACIERRIAIEADSYLHHGHRDGFERDCTRYDELAVRGWLVLRFTWRQVMLEPDWVVSTLRAALALHSRRRPGLRQPRQPRQVA